MPRPRNANGDDGPAPRVLVVAPEPFYEDRGTPISVRYLLEALSEIGLAADVLTYPLGRTVEIPGVRYCRTANPLGFRSVPVGLSFRKLFLDVLLTARLRRQLRDGRYVCVQAVEEMAFVALVLGKRSGLPVIYDMQSSLPEQLMQHPLLRLRPLRRVFRAAERWLLSRVDCVICSTGLADHVRSIGPDIVIREWWFPGQPRVDRETKCRLREDLRIPPSSRIVAYCGTFEPYQGLTELRDAIPMVLRDATDTFFVLVGARDSAELTAFERSLDPVARDHVRLLPRQPRDLMSRFLTMADVLVSPRATGANIPLKIFDYMAAGKAIVATDIPAHRRVLSGQTSVLVPPAAEELGGAIGALLADPDRAVRLGAAALRYAEENLGWAQFVERVRRIYEPLSAVASTAPVAEPGR